MFALKITTTILTVASATFAHPTLYARSGRCSSGTLQCCNSIAPTESSGSGLLGGDLPMNLQGLTGSLGINCNPFAMSGLGSAGTCSTQAACCNDIDYSGAVPMGISCSPFNMDF